MNNSKKNEREKLEKIVLSGKDGVEEHAKDQNSGIVSPEINSTVLLTDLITRRLTGVKYGPSRKSLSKDRILKDQIGVTAKSLKMALDKFGKDQPKTFLTNVSIKRVSACIGKGN